MSEISRIAGVSSATVDRVLNNREGVRERTRKRVLDAARQVGYFGLSTPSDRSSVRIAFLLPEGPNSFMKGLRALLLEEAQRRPDVAVRVIEVAGPMPDAYVTALRKVVGTCDAVGVVAPDHPQVREALAQLVQSGIHVATLVSDIPAISKVGYVGVDNRAAGRLAGLIVGRFAKAEGKLRVAVFIGSPAYRGHEEREMGFRSLLAEDFPDIEICDFVEVGDDRAKAYREARRILETSDIHGIYNIGAGNQGIVQAIKESRKWRDVVFVGHDLTEATRIALLDRTMDAVIEQNPRIEAREVLRALCSAVRGEMEPEYLPRLQVILRENIPMR